MPIGLPGEVVASFSEYASPWKILAKVLFTRRSLFFQLFLPFAIFYCSSHHLKNYLKCVCLLATLNLLSVFMWLWVCAKNLLIDFTDKIFRENMAPSEDFFFPDSFFFTWRRSCQIMGPCCSDTAFARHRLASTVFWDDKISFLGWILFVFRIVTLNLRYYLMVVFGLISADFATYSLALPKHVVSIVIKRLITSTSFALSTLALMFCNFFSFCDFELEKRHFVLRSSLIQKSQV